MRDRLHVLLIGTLFLSAVASADVRGESDQTDWSGGPGVTGPVPAFGTRYDTGDLGAFPVPGQLALSSSPRSTFPLTVITADSDRPTRIAVADIDGDGSNDILATDPIMSPFDPDNLRGAIYLWTCHDGVWSRRSITESFYGSWYVDAVDLDRDGDLDVIATAYYGEIDPPPPPPEARNGRYAWFENLDGVGGSWEQREIGELFWGARWVDAVDVDGDGDLDLAGCAELVGGPYEADAFVVWFENVDGEGESWSQHDVSTSFDNAFEIRGADVDLDGDQDFIVAGYDRFEWIENGDGAGTAWTRHVITPTFGGAGYFDITDFDHDGDVDIVGSGLNTNSIAVWMNDGTGLGWDVYIVGPWPGGYNVDLGDLDGDGDLDMVTSGRSDVENAKVGFAINQGDGKVWSLIYVEVVAPSSPWARAADVDDDGRLELVVSFEDPYNVGIQLGAYTITDFVSGGALQSSILDGGAEPDWGTITWDADTPAGTTLDVAVRASNDPGDLGVYVTVPASETDLASLIDPAARYVQYRVDMSSSDPSVSPILREIDLDGAAVVAVDPASAGPGAMMRVGAVWPNPTGAGTHVELELGATGRIRAAVYDVVGRRIAVLGDAVLGAGRHAVRWDGTDDRGDEVAAGTYFLRLEGGTETVSRRVVRTR